MNASMDSLRQGLADLADEVRPVDLRDRVLRTSRRIAVRRTMMTSTALVAVLGAVSGVAFATLPQRGSVPPPVTGTTPTPSPDVSPSTPPSTPPSVPAVEESIRILPGRLFYQTDQGPLLINAWDGTTVTKVLQPDDTSMPFAVRISPDGSRFVWVTNASELYVANADGSGARKVRDNVLGECVEPVWTADSRRVLVAPFRFVHGVPEGHDLGYLDLSSGVFQPIRDLQGCHFTLSPGGEYLAYVDGSKGEVTISGPGGTGSRIVPALGSDDPQINPQRARSFDIHSLSPDGNMLICFLLTGDLPWGDVALSMRSNAVMDTRTGKRVSLPVNGELLNGVFLHDGSLLARLKGPTRNELVLISKEWTVLDRIDEPAELKDQWLQAYLPG